MKSFSEGDPCILFGKGAYGVVRGYRHHVTRKLYAIKSTNRHEKSENEVNITSQLQQYQRFSPFLVQMISSFKDKDEFCICMEPCLGGSLHQHISIQKGLTYEQCRLFSTELLAAVQFLHDVRCIHRDIKANNCLLDHNGHLKLSDFGNAVILPADKDRTFTILGSLHHVAPEMIARNVGYDNSVDLWSVGVVFHEMLTGAVPAFAWFKDTNSSNPSAIVISDHQSTLARRAIDCTGSIDADIAGIWDINVAKRFEIRDADSLSPPKSFALEALVAYHTAKQQITWQNDFFGCIVPFFTLSPERRKEATSRERLQGIAWYHGDILRHPLSPPPSTLSVAFDRSVGFIDIASGLEDIEAERKDIMSVSEHGAFAGF